MHVTSPAETAAAALVGDPWIEVVNVEEHDGVKARGVVVAWAKGIDEHI